MEKINGLFASFEEQQEENEKQHKLRLKHRVDDPNIKVVPKTLIYVLLFIKNTGIILLIVFLVVSSVIGWVSCLHPDTRQILIMQLEQTISEVRMLIGG